MSPKPTLADLRQAKDDLVGGQRTEVAAGESVLRAEALRDEALAAHQAAEEKDERSTQWGNVQAARQALKNAQQAVKEAQELQQDAIRRGAELVAD